MPESTIYFDDYELRPQPLMLLRDARPVALSAQPLRLLQLLASHAGEVVAHEEIHNHLWGSQVVDFAGGVHVCVRQIRAALGDNGDRPRYIENIPRRGYRFLPAIRSEPFTQASDAPTHRRVTPSPNDGASAAWPRQRWAVLAMSFVLIIVAVLFVRERTPVQLTSEPAAMDAYKRGQYVLDSNEANNLQRSRLFFREAIAADPGFAAAHAAMADSYQRELDFAAARPFAKTALALDPELAEAHLRIAAVLGMGDWQWDAAETHIVQALDLDPDSAEAHHALASIYSVTGRLPLAAKPMEVALAIDPASTLLRADYGSFLYYLGRLDDAQQQCAAALRIDPEHHPSRMCLINIAAGRKRYDEATALAGQVMRDWQADVESVAQVTTQPTAAGVAAFQQWRHRLYQNADPAQISPAAYATVQASLGNFGESLALLEQAVDEQRPMTPFLVLDPVFEPIHDHVRFRAVLGTMNVTLN